MITQQAGKFHWTSFALHVFSLSSGNQQQHKISLGKLETIIFWLFARKMPRILNIHFDGFSTSK
jgi:hypothetical protein